MRDFRETKKSIFYLIKTKLIDRLKKSQKINEFQTLCQKDSRSTES